VIAAHGDVFLFRRLVVIGEMVFQTCEGSASTIDIMEENYLQLANSIPAKISEEDARFIKQIIRAEEK
jgi:hypothetical protein